MSRQCEGLTKNMTQCSRRTLKIAVSDDCDLENKCWQHLIIEDHLKVADAYHGNRPIGKGLYAMKNYHIGETVAEYTGKEVLNPNAPIHNDDHYMFQVQTPHQNLYCISAKDPVNSDVSRYINDAYGAAPANQRHGLHNVQITNDVVGCIGKHDNQGRQLRSVEVVAVQPIHAGEELLTDYGPNYWGVAGNQPVKIGAPKKVKAPKAKNNVFKMPKNAWVKVKAPKVKGPKVKV